MPRQRTEFSRAHVRWLGAAALVALAPKCFLCVLAYVGVGTALGLNGPEICGGAGDTPHLWTTWLAFIGITAAAVSASVFGVCRCRRPSKRSGNP